MWTMIFGTAAAVILRASLTGAASFLMELPYLKLIGGAALAFIAIKLLLPENEDGDGADAPERMIKAIITIVVADITMSIDNVIAVAAASYGDITLLVIGLVVSIPIVIGGATIISSFLDRFPFLIWAGSALLGWIAGEVIVSDPIVRQFLAAPFDWPPIYGALGVSVVMFSGALWRSAKERAAIRTET